MHRGWYSRIRQLSKAQDRVGDQITVVALAVILAMIGVVGLASVAVSPAHRGTRRWPRPTALSGSMVIMRSLPL